jgi:hypothetical protein
MHRQLERYGSPTRVEDCEPLIQASEEERLMEVISGLEELRAFNRLAAHNQFMSYDEAKQEGIADSLLAISQNVVNGRVLIHFLTDLGEVPTAGEEVAGIFFADPYFWNEFARQRWEIFLQNGTMSRYQEIWVNSYAGTWEEMGLVERQGDKSWVVSERYKRYMAWLNPEEAGVDLELEP